MCTPGAYADQPGPAAAGAQGAAHETAQAANPFADVPASSWAYQAVRQLAADGLITGYPDGQFKGARPMTRYEMAVLVNKAVEMLERKMTAGTQPAVNPSDVAAVRRLVDEFGAELKK